MSSPASRKPVLTETVVVRMPPKLRQALVRQQTAHETLSDTIRRLLTSTEKPK